MVHFTKICLFLLNGNAQKFDKTHLFLVGFFRCGYYSRASFIGAGTVVDIDKKIIQVVLLSPQLALYGQKVDKWGKRTIHDSS